ncbi:hypothetical protein PMIN04_000378 [Paraphaeosphaeria minitans]
MQQQQPALSLSHSGPCRAFRSCHTAWLAWQHHPPSPARRLAASMSVIEPTVTATATARPRNHHQHHHHHHQHQHQHHHQHQHQHQHHHQHQHRPSLHVASPAVCAAGDAWWRMPIREPPSSPPPLPIIASSTHKPPRDSALGTAGMPRRRTISRTISEHAVAHAAPKAQAPHGPAEQGPVLWLSSIACTTAGIATQIWSRSVRTDPRYYWTISAELARDSSSCLQRAPARATEPLAKSSALAHLFSGHLPPALPRRTGSACSLLLAPCSLLPREARLLTTRATLKQVLRPHSLERKFPKRYRPSSTSPPPAHIPARTS